MRATFAETENGELDVILKKIQETIILPAYLPQKQRRIVFDPQMRSYLEQNPIVIEVEGMEHKFSSLNRFSDIEDSKTILKNALEKMQTADDWNNLATLLAGYKKAGIKLQPVQMGKIVRLAGETGNIYSIIECAEQAYETGLSLSKAETTVRLLLFVNDKSINNKGDAAQANQALRWTTKVMDLLQRSESKLATGNTRDRLHFSKAVRGLVLFARASAVKANEAAGEAVEQQMTLLRDEVELVGSLWKDSLGQDITQVPDFSSLNPKFDGARNNKTLQQNPTLSGSGYIQVLAQNIKAMSLTREIVGDEAKQLQDVEAQLKSHAEQFLDNAGEAKESWTKEYKRIIE